MSISRSLCKPVYIQNSNYIRRSILFLLLQFNQLIKKVNKIITVKIGEIKCNTSMYDYIRAEELDIRINDKNMFSKSRAIIYDKPVDML